MTAETENLQNEEARSSNSKLKKINNLLNSSQTRVSGLKLLSSFLPECSDEDFIECCVNWMQHCCKIDGSLESSNTSIQILNELLKFSSNYSELKKSVSFFITTRFFDHFFKNYINSPTGWSCAQTCFLLYKGACGPYQATITDHLIHKVDQNMKILPVIAQCCALLPCLGGGGNEGVNYKTNWKSEFTKFVHICHSILNDLFVGVVEELQEYDTAGHSYKHKNVKINADFLTVQLYNYCAVLSSMLLNKYPAPKCIPTDAVLQMICRGLAANPKNLGHSRTTNIISLEKVLPEIHAVLHSLLRALVVTCGIQLLPYSHLIVKLVKQTLEWTDGNFIYGSEKPFAPLRISAYETLCNWLAATKSGSCVETISKAVILNAVADIHSKKTVTLLKESKRREPLREKENSRRRVDSSANSALCRAASKALQFVIKFSGVSLKVEEHKLLQEVVIKLLVDIQNSSPSDMLIPYSVAACRVELYSLLQELIQQPCTGHPPPTHFALRIFSRGQADACLAVSEFCSSAINVITNIIHSQFDNGGFGAATGEAVQREDTLRWNSEAMEVDGEDDRSLEREVESSPVAEKAVDSAVASNTQEDEKKLSNQSDSKAPSRDSSTTTVIYENADEENIDVVELVEEENAMVDDEKSSDIYVEWEGPSSSKKRKSKEGGSSSEEKKSSPVKTKKLEFSSPSKKAQQVQDKTPQKPSPTKAKEPESTSPLEAVEQERDRTPQRSSPLRAKEPESTSPFEAVEQERDRTPQKSSPLRAKEPESTSPFEAVEQERDRTPQKSSPPKAKEPESTSPLEAVEQERDKTPQKSSPSKDEEKSAETEDASSGRSVSSDSPGDEKPMDSKKRYFLRSKTCKASSEEPETVTGLESFRTPTPTRSLTRTFASKKRPRTRALSKIEDEIEETPSKKESLDEDEDIIESFYDSLVD